MASLFTRIIEGKIPCHKLLENEKYFSFLDIRPISIGHTLVIPKLEEDYLFDLPEDILAGLLPFSRRLVPALEKVTQCKRVGVMVAGLEIPHAHIHLVPMYSEGDLTFAHASPAEPEELKALAANIRAAL